MNSVVLQYIRKHRILEKAIKGRIYTIYMRYTTMVLAALPAVLGLAAVTTRPLHEGTGIVVEVEDMRIIIVLLTN